MQSCLPVLLTRHAMDKLATYGIDKERFTDASTGASGLLMDWEGRPWIVILREDVETVVTTYPSDGRTVQNRFGGGRWILLNT